MQATRMPEQTDVIADPLVHCYSGHTYAQEPRSFMWQGQCHEVAEIERRWREPDGPRFRVRTVNGRRWRLGYDERKASWTIEILT
jgi:hypothetical protein